MVAVRIELRPLPELARVLERNRVQFQSLAELLDVLVRRAREVDPEELVALAERLDPPDVDLRQDVHG